MNYFTIIFLICCAAVSNGIPGTASPNIIPGTASGSLISGTSSHNGTEATSSRSLTPGTASGSLMSGTSSHSGTEGTSSRSSIPVTSSRSLIPGTSSPNGTEGSSSHNGTEGSTSNNADGGTSSGSCSEVSFKIQGHVDCFFKAKNDVKFYIYNHHDLNHPYKLQYNSIIKQDWVNSRWKTVVFIHGWRGGHRLAEVMKNAYLDESDQHVNLIEADWLRGAYSPLYCPSARRVPNVGETVANFIGLNQKKFNMNRLIIVGHSLGAHAAGIAGKFLQSNYNIKLRLIVGLDPAGPLFQPNTTPKMQPEDADTVLVIHTSQRFGHLEPLGTVDAYINGGKIQPGCTDCQSHGFAKLIYKELVKGTEPLVGRRYSSFADVLNDIVPQKQDAHLFRIDPCPGPGTLMYISTMEQPHLIAEVKEYIDSKLHNDVGECCTVM